MEFPDVFPLARSIREKGKGGGLIKGISGELLATVAKGKMKMRSLLQILTAPRSEGNDNNEHEGRGTKNIFPRPMRVPTGKVVNLNKNTSFFIRVV